MENTGRVDKEEKIWIVGIGASAGGLEALTQFVAALPPESQACYIVAQHLAPHAKSMMVELIARHSPIPVEVAVSDQPLVPNRLFIVPPNFDVDIQSGKLKLTKAGDETRPKPSVDRFFSSLGSECGPRAIGVILSGTGSDGAEGIRTIKASGGITVAQDDVSAKYAGMPNSALETGQVDFVLSASDIAKKLSEIIGSDTYLVAGETFDASPAFAKIIALIRREIGSDFSQYKHPTIKRRLAKRMQSRGIEDLNEYYGALCSDDHELRALAQEFLVSVTSFFRDKDAFDALALHIEQIIERLNDGEEIRAWSAGCATGEEAYTLAMIMRDKVEKSGKTHPIKIFATDLDSEAISKARLALYSERDLAELPSGYRERFFEQAGDWFEVKKTIKDHLVIARQDLVQSPPFVKLDLICCRNVVIYFEPTLQQKVFEIFGYGLKPGGVLFLGKSEGIGSASDTFDLLDKKSKIFVKKMTAPRKMPAVVRLPLHDMAQVRKRITVQVSPVQSAQLQLLERHGVAGALIDSLGQIQTIIGNTSKFLTLQPGLDSFTVQSMLPRTAVAEFQLLLRRAVKSKQLESSRAFKLNDRSSDTDYFVIKVSPFDSRDEATTVSPALLLLSFEVVSQIDSVAAPTLQPDGDLALRAIELEQELHATKEHLQTVIEELGVTNEELQSINEELSSTNEELQSSNEELETTNEEFQSTNEELSTINEELNVRSADLRLAFADLENIQTSISIPIIVVDQDLRVQRFNPTTTEIFDIGPADIGRNLSRVSSRCEIELFSAKVEKVIETGEPNEFTVEAFKSVYLMRITPRRDDVGRIAGAVICFFNNTELVQTEKRLRRSELLARGIINGTSSVIFIKDMAGKYLSVNEAFLETFGLEEKAVIGKSDREVFDSQFANQLRNGDLQAALKRARFEQQETFPTANGEGNFLVSRFLLTEDASSNPYAVGTVAVDVSEQIKAQVALTRSESLYRGVVEDQAVFVVRFDPSGIVRFVNAAFVRYFGGSSSDYVGKPFTSIIDGYDRSYVTDELSRLSSTHPTSQVEHRNTRFGNTVRWIRWINKAVINDKNQLDEVQAVGFDVTEYRVQTDQMVQREMLFSNIFTYTTDFLTVFKLTSNGELLLESFNRSVEDGGSYSYASLIGRNVRELVSAQHSVEILEKYRQCVDLKEPQSFDEELSIQGSTRYLSTTIIPVINNNGKVERVVALSRDISKYKKAEAELHTAKAAAEIANESKSDFLASMSHELRSPLNVVIGMAELLESASLEPQEREQVKSIQRSGKVLLSLIEDILDISKIEAGKTKLEFTNFSLRELLEDVTSSFDHQVKAKKIKLVVDIEKESPENFVGDAARIRQILVNLIGNAVKFTEKGKVTVTVESVGHRTTGRRLVRFEIKDSGIGIPEEDHARIFKKFSQVDSGLGRKYGGSGLGLVISQRLTTLMNGQIGFTSKWTEGSTFWFELPLTIAKKPKGSSPTGESSSPILVERKARILAIDDSPDSRMLLKMLLNRLGHFSEVVDGGDAGIEAVQRGTFDMILMDVQMPGLDGYQTTSLIRKLNHPNSTLPIIACTANAMVGDSEKCFEAGMNDYLTKPLNIDMLKRKISTWVVHNADSAISG